ncbi:MAG TPA: hypothetical protein DC017_07545 [Candidatus Wallbacteria bacterium]|nr:hypothetical protein [Candidatus Wallbacteria bacterium]
MSMNINFEKKKKPYDRLQYFQFPALFTFYYIHIIISIFINIFFSGAGRLQFADLKLSLFSLPFYV